MSSSMAQQFKRIEVAMAVAPPRPKSPPASPDPCGRHRLQLAVDALHREISFLEGEISSIEGVHAASRCCKEVDEFVGRNPDPFIMIGPEKRSNDQSPHSKKFRAKSCLGYLSWMICCCGGCSLFQLMRPPPASCSCAGQLRRRCCSSSCCRCRVAYESCCGGCCPRYSCDCSCSCPSCSCACPSCSDACCVPRCCLCL